MVEPTEPEPKTEGGAKTYPDHRYTCGMNTREGMGTNQTVPVQFFAI